MNGAAHHDFETRSTVDLKKAGAARYAEHPRTSAWCMAWQIGKGPKHLWRPGDPDPVELLAHLRAGGRIVAHNAAFERAIWNGPIRRLNPYWPILTPEMQDCTMARALAMALPAQLDQLSVALKLAVNKDREGQRLMMQMCRPRSIDPCMFCGGGSYVCQPCDGTGEIVTWWDDAPRQERLGSYCGTDVDVEVLADDDLPALSESERLVWLLDQHINDRGVALDVHLIERALEAVEEALARADRKMWRLTDGAVKRCSEAAKIVSWLAARGIHCTSVAKGEIDELIISSQVMSDPTAEEVIRLRRDAAKSSTAKFKAMLNCVCADGRARGALQYHGAGQTGRWAGRLWQPQNFPRVDPDRDLPDVLRTLDVLATAKSRSELVDSLEMLVDAPLGTLSKCLRAMIIAGPGKKFVGGDLSNIEGRVNAWLAGETWKIQAFRDFDTIIGHDAKGKPIRKGPDLYEVTAADILGKAIELVTKGERQSHGKIPELAGGYQGSVGAFITMGATYLVKAADVARVSLENATAEQRREAEWQFAKESKRGRTYGLPQDVWVGVKIVVNGYRAKNAQIVKAWWELQDAAIEAVASPGLTVPVLSGRVKYLVANGFLFCCLPSGRVIAYAAPRIKRTETEKARAAYDAPGMAGEVVHHEATKAKHRYNVEYDGLDSETHKWTAQSLYGGLQAENIVQAVSRDVMVEAMFTAEADGMPIVLTVHDELLCEVDEFSNHGAKRLEEIMTTLPPWAHGLPLAANAWEDRRYVK